MLYLTRQDHTSLQTCEPMKSSKLILGLASHMLCFTIHIAAISIAGFNNLWQQTLVGNIYSSVHMYAWVQLSTYSIFKHGRFPYCACTVVLCVVCMRRKHIEINGLKNPNRSVPVEIFTHQCHSYPTSESTFFHPHGRRTMFRRHPILFEPSIVMKARTRSAIRTVWHMSVIELVYLQPTADTSLRRGRREGWKKASLFAWMHQVAFVAVKALERLIEDWKCATAIAQYSISGLQILRRTWHCEYLIAEFAHYRHWKMRYIRWGILGIDIWQHAFF